MIWFGALVAVTLQTAFLSPPVAMSAYYLRQVVREWSLGTIYKGMFEFMILQCVAIALLVMFPAIATTFPEHLQKVARETRSRRCWTTRRASSRTRWSNCRRSRRRRAKRRRRPTRSRRATSNPRVRPK